MSLLSSFTSADKELLKLSPFWVFHLVSGADGEIDFKETKQFKDNLFDFTTKLFIEPEFTSHLLDAEISISILESVNANFAEMESAINRYSNDYLNHLQKVGSFVDSNLTKNEAQLFKQIMVNLAVNIADSSGGWKFLKNNISKLEAQSIIQLKKAIKYREPFQMPF